MGDEGMHDIWDACARWDNDYNAPLERRRSEQDKRTAAADKAQERRRG